jgi:hypothetical protein
VLDEADALHKLVELLKQRRFEEEKLLPTTTRRLIITAMRIKNQLNPARGMQKREGE